MIGGYLEQQAEPILTWQGIIVSYHLQVLAVPGSPGISCKNPIKGEVLQQNRTRSVIQARQTCYTKTAKGQPCALSEQA